MENKIRVIWNRIRLALFQIQPIWDRAEPIVREIGAN
jgi:hypothetical protein